MKKEVWIDICQGLNAFDNVTPGSEKQIKECLNILIHVLNSNLLEWSPYIGGHQTVSRPFIKDAT